MRLLPRLLAVFAACAVFPAAHAACSAATIKGYYSAMGSGAYSSTYLTVGVAHVYFNGANAVSVSSYKEGEDGGVHTFTGYGSYTLDSLCRGSASIALKENGVAAGSISLSFVVSGTPASPQIQALVSNATTGFTGAAVMNKINL